MAKCVKIIGLINYRVSAVGMITIFFLMCWTTIHAAVRKFTQYGGIDDALPITELLMVLMIFCGLAFMQSERGHIRVDFLVMRMPKIPRKTLEIAMLVIAAVFIFIMFYAAVNNIVPIYLKNAQTTVLKIPFWPFWIAVAVGLFLYAFTLLLHAIECIVSIAKKEKPETETGSQIIPDNS